LDPLGVEHVGLGACAAPRQVPRFHPLDLEAVGFEPLEPRNPEDTGGFPSDRFPPARLQPGGDFLKIGRVGTELADGFWVAVGGDADPMHVGMNVDSGRVRVDDRQRC
jgi:hypothetical protein